MAVSSSDLRRFRLDLAYDGRPFLGWQSQTGGRTVQDEVQRALRAICPSISTVQGSGRTDTGVSALAQVAHFDAPLDWRMDGAAWQRALNTKLPPSIRAWRCFEVPSDFHARYSAVEKTYEYRIAVGEVLLPLRHGLAWHQRGLGPADELAAILSRYEGSHDFRAFSAKRHDGRDESRDTRRTIHEASLSLSSEPDEWLLRFRGDGFLYKMVRFLVGTAVQTLWGRFPLSELEQLLKGVTDDRKAPYCAPPDGLMLVHVRYPEAYEGGAASNP